jgi:hypothetical protein
MPFVRPVTRKAILRQNRANLESEVGRPFFRGNGLRAESRHCQRGEYAAPHFEVTRHQRPSPPVRIIFICAKGQKVTVLLHMFVRGFSNGRAIAVFDPKATLDYKIR